MSTTLIVGGSGALGSALAKRLMADGTPVRVMTRKPARAASLAALGAEVVQGDLLDRDVLVRACQGVDAVVAAAHAVFGRGRSASVHVDGRGHRDLIEAARAAGVCRFVYTSVYDHGPAYREVPFFRIKQEVERHLERSGLPYTILRPTAFMETHAHTLIGEPILRGRRVLLFGRGEQPRNFVAAGDVARIAARALGDQSMAGQIVDIGGPENLTSLDVVRIYERASGRPAKVVHVPLGVPRVLSRLLRPVHPGLSQVLQAGILADTTDQRFDAGPLRKRFGLEPTRLEDWVAQELGRQAGSAPVPGATRAGVTD